MTGKKITIYTIPTCVYCRMAKSFFGTRGLSFEEKDVLENAEARLEMLAKSGAKAVPVIDVDGEVFVGFNRERLREALGEV